MFSGVLILVQEIAARRGAQQYIHRKVGWLTFCDAAFFNSSSVSGIFFGANFNTVGAVLPNQDLGFPVDA